MVPSFIAPSDAPGPTLPWLDAPPPGWVRCAKAPGVASAKMQAEAKSIFFIWSPWGLVYFTKENGCGSRSFLSWTLSGLYSIYSKT
jgi:hypothetical protein